VNSVVILCQIPVLINALSVIIPKAHISARDQCHIFLCWQGVCFSVLWMKNTQYCKCFRLGGQWLLLLTFRKYIFIIASPLIEKVFAILWLGYKKCIVAVINSYSFISFLCLQKFPSYDKYLHIYIYGLYSDAVSNSECKVLNDGMISDHSLEGMCKEQPWSSFR
jgi:hypothetical protein